MLSTLICLVVPEFVFLASGLDRDGSFAEAANSLLIEPLIGCARLRRDLFLTGSSSSSFSASSLEVSLSDWLALFAGDL